MRSLPNHRLLPALLLWAALAWTQAPCAPEPGPKPDGTAVASGAGAPPPQPHPPQAAETREPRISPQQAEELFRSVDTILDFVSHDTGLTIRHPVKRKLASRELVERYIEERLADEEDAKRLERSELVLKKFGLLPGDFDLKRFLLALYREQVAGFYNHKDQTVYLLDWVPAEQQQEAVLAHELTHALQDQNYHLEDWMKEARQAGDRAIREPENGVDADEEVEARAALVEGQGMAVMFDFVFAPAGRTLADSPLMAEALKAGMEAGQQNPVFGQAPLLIRESMMFPYRYGLSFVQALLAKGGKQAAFDGALRRPPRSTHEIMYPAAYLKPDHVPPTRLPKLDSQLGKNYERYDVGSVGQFDVYIILKQFADEKLADQLTPDWRGGAYYAARRTHSGAPASEATRRGGPAASASGSEAQGAPAPEATSTPSGFGRSSEAQGAPAPEATSTLSGFGRSSEAQGAAPATATLALLYVSRWASPEAARKFAYAYTQALPQRYKSVRRQPPTEGSKSATTQYATNEGTVWVEQQAETVLIMESFDDETAARLRRAVLQPSWAAAGSGGESIFEELAWPALPRNLAAPASEAGSGLSDFGRSSGAQGASLRLR